ncbi:MAG: hypothetical protein HY238_25105 [Acidobacteria bacterium]|nr:hypothetical protein [Acidobacteriota bacterium]
MPSKRSQPSARRSQVDEGYQHETPLEAHAAFLKYSRDAEARFFADFPSLRTRAAQLRWRS